MNMRIYLLLVITPSFVECARDVLPHQRHGPVQSGERAHLHIG